MTPGRIGPDRNADTPDAMNPKLLRPAALAFAAAIALLAPPVDAQKRGTEAAKTIYCWDDDGKRVCGDALPADAVDNARSEFSASGMLTRKLGRALTEEERAAAEALAELERQAADDAAARERQERAMVHAYDSAEALQRAFNARLELVAAAARSSELGIESIRGSLMGLLRQAAEAELAGRAVPESIAGGIPGRRYGLRRQQGRLERQQGQQRVRAEGREQALLRCRELRQASVR